MDFWKSLPQIVRQILVVSLAFVAGGAISFGYSYRPLHGALTFKVAALESQLDERNLENSRLKDQLAGIEEQGSDLIEPEVLSEIESKLAKTEQSLASAEKKIEVAEKKRREASTSADRWRKRFESLRKQHEGMPAVTAPVAPETPSARSVAPSNDAEPTPAIQPTDATPRDSAILTSPAGEPAFDRDAPPFP